MTSNSTETDFFDGIGGGSGAPSAHLKNLNDTVAGEIVDMYKRDFIPFGKKEPEKREDGTTKQQLVIVLQTTHRNWENVSKVPDVDQNDPTKGQKPPSEDDGKRAVYVPENKDIAFAIGRAASEAKARPAVGGQLAVKIFDMKDTEFGNQQKKHVARYTPPSAAGAFFAETQAAPAQQATPPAPVEQAQPAQQQAQQAAPAQPSPAPAADPWATPAAPAATTPGDPWATPTQGAPAPF